MRSAAVAMLVAAGFGLGAASGASAAPAKGSAIAELGQRIVPVIQIRRDAGAGAIGIWDTASQDADSVGSSPIQTLSAVQDNRAALATATEHIFRLSSDANSLVHISDAAAIPHQCEWLGHPSR
jgi:hypothetical protein